jgi:hypothetical protein
MYSNDIIITKILNHAWKKHKIKRKKYLIKGPCHINICVCFFSHIEQRIERKDKTI